MRAASGNDTLRVAVVGAGVMGHNHMRVYDMIAGVKLVAVVDTDRRKAEAAATHYGCRASRRPEQSCGAG